MIRITNGTEVLSMTSKALAVVDREGSVASIELTDEMKEQMWRMLRIWKSSNYGKRV